VLEPEQFYEWTTNYVDESKEADEVDPGFIVLSLTLA